MLRHVLLDLPAEEILGTQGVALDLPALLADKLPANLPQRRCLPDHQNTDAKLAMQRVDFQDWLINNPKRARQVWVREFQGNNAGGSCFVYVCRPTGSEHAREMSHQMQGDAVVDWLLKEGDPIC